MTNSKSVQQQNRELAQRINDEAMRDPTSQYAGKFVGLANGQVVVVADDLDASVRQLQQAEPDPQKTFIIEAGLDYDAPIEVWRAELMAHVAWPLVGGRPIVQVTLVGAAGQTVSLDLLADTGAGAAASPFELLLEQQTCARYGGNPGQPINLQGAYAGSFPVYVVRATIAALNFDQYVRAVGVSTVPRSLSGIACFRLLNQFTFGNFGNLGQFGLEA